MRADTPGYSTRRRIRLFVCGNLASVTPTVLRSFSPPMFKTSEFLASEILLSESRVPNVRIELDFYAFTCIEYNKKIYRSLKN